MPPQSEGTDLSKRSCIRCNRRKVRCDRKHPCKQCLQAKAECIHPGNKRAPRKLSRLPIAALRSRLQQLEEEVERLQAGGGQSVLRSRSADEADQRQPLHVEAKRLRGMLVVQDETRARYVGDEASVVLRDKDREHPGSESELGVDAGRMDPLQPLQMEMLWQVYKSNVAPMITVLHTPSIESVIRDTCAKPDVELDPGSSALLRAVFFAAMVSMDPANCWSVVGEECNVCLREFRLAVARSLAKANLVSSDDVRVLQAAVVYLLCVRCGCDSEQVWVEAAIVVHVAQRQGIHRDGQNLGLSPFDIETRRRLWSYICMLDILYSEDQGTDTQIRPEMFDTRPPLNIDSDDLSSNMAELPPPQAGLTDITLCIIQYEIMTHLSWTDKSFGLEEHQSTWTDEQTPLSKLAASLGERYLHKFDLKIPIQWVTAVIFRLTLSKASLVNRLSKAAMDKEPTATDDEIFSLAVEILKFSSLLQNNEMSAPWAWLCRSYKQEHVMALILSQLCSRPISAETDHAWDLVKGVYDEWEQGTQKTNSQMQEPVSRLMERASISRRLRGAVE